MNDVSEFVHADNIQQDFEGVFDTQVSSFLKSEEQRPALEGSRSRFNNSGMASYNFIYKPNTKFELKALSFGMFNNDDFQRNGRRTYELHNLFIEDSEEYKINQYLQSGYGRVTASFEQESKYSFTYDGFVLKSHGENNADMLFNAAPSKQFTKSNNWDITQQLNFENRLNENNALLISGSYRYQSTYEKLNEFPFLPAELFSDQEQNSDAYQKFTLSNHAIDLQAKIISRITSNVTLEPKLGIQSLHNDLKSYLFLVDDEPVLITDENFHDNLTYTGYDMYGGILGRRYFQNFSLYVAGDEHFLNYKLRRTLEDEITEGFPFIEPSAGFDWQINQKNKLQGNYSLNATSTSLSNLTDSYSFRGNRTYKRSLGAFTILRGHTYFFHYTYGNWIDRMVTNATFLYNFNSKHLATEALITPEYNLIGQHLGGNRNLWQISLNNDLYLNFIKNNLKLKGSYFSTTSSGNEINANRTELTSNYLKYGFELRSVFDQFFNYSLGSDWILNQQVVNSDVAKSYNDQFQFVDVYLNFSKKIKATVVFERYYFGDSDYNNNYFYLDGFLSYHIKPDKWQINLEIRNVLNNKSFHQYQFTDYGIESTEYRMVPRYILASIYYRI